MAICFDFGAATDTDGTGEGVGSLSTTREIPDTDYKCKIFLAHW